MRIQPWPERRSALAPTAAAFSASASSSSSSSSSSFACFDRPGDAMCGSSPGQSPGQPFCFCCFFSFHNSCMEQMYSMGLSWLL